MPADYAAQKPVEHYNKTLEIDPFNADFYTIGRYPVRQGQFSTGGGRNGKALALKPEDQRNKKVAK